MLGAFVPVAMKYSSAHAEGVAVAVKTARLLAAVASSPSPFLVLADDNGTDPLRTKIAGRVTPKDGLSPAEWKIFAGGANQIARAVLTKRACGRSSTITAPVTWRRRMRSQPCWN